MKKDEWALIVHEVVAEHPEWVDATIEGIQSGIHEALDRRMDRITDLSYGLYEALNTRRGSIRRDGERIIKAINASQFANTKWSAETIAKEEAK